MRTVLLGALALGSGCNQIFGLDPVTLTDARIIDAPPDAPLPTVKLSGLTPILDDNTHVPLGVSAKVPLSPEPALQYGLIDGPLIDTAYTAMDNVAVGYELATSPPPWRLVYTLDGSVPHEVHWQPASVDLAQAATLQLTPTDRDPVPVGMSFSLDPTGHTGGWVNPRVYTTNTWTITEAPDVQGTAVVAHFGNVDTRAMAGAKRKPDPIKDDEVLVEYEPGPPCIYSTGSAAFRIDLATGVPTDAQTWSTAKAGAIQIKAAGASGATADDLILNLVLAHALPNASSLVTYRIVTQSPAGNIPLYRSFESSFPFPTPVGILLARCSGTTTNLATNLPLFNVPTRTSGLSIARTLVYMTPPLALSEGGATVVNGVAMSNAMANAATTPSGYDANFSQAAFATDPTIDDNSVKITETLTIGIPTGGTTAKLVFSLAGADPKVDLYEATLMRVDGATLTPIREFTFTKPELVFTRDQGVPATTKLLFQIRAIRGAMGTTAGNFGTWGDTQTIAVTHTQIFTLAH